MSRKKGGKKSGKKGGQEKVGKGNVEDDPAVLKRREKQIQGGASGRTLDLVDFDLTTSAVSFFCLGNLKSGRIGTAPGQHIGTSKIKVIKT